jgi:hypothetical protein
MLRHNRPQAICLLARRVNVEQRQPLLNEAIAAIKSHPHEDDRPRFLKLIVDLLDVHQLSDALTIAATIAPGRERAYALETLAGYLLGDQINEALAQAIALSEPNWRARALRNLAPRLTPAQLRAAISAAKRISDEDVQAKTLIAISQHLDAKERNAALNESLVIAKTIGHAGARFDAIMMLASNLKTAPRGKLLNEALSAAVTIEDDMTKCDAFCRLAPHLTAAQIARAVVATKDFADVYRIKALAALAKRAPGRQRNEILQEALSTAKMLHLDFAVVDALEYLAGLLTVKQLRTAMALSMTLKDDNSRVTCIVSLARYLPKSDRRKALCSALESAHKLDKSHEASALIKILGQLSGQQRTCVVRDTLAALRSVGEDRLRSIGLGELSTLLLTVEELVLALDIARGINDASWRSFALYQIGRHLNVGERRRHILTEALSAVKSIQNGSDRARALRMIADSLDEDLVDVALTIVRTLPRDRDRDRERLLSCLSGRLTLRQFGEALSITSAIANSYDRAVAFSSLAAHFGDQQRIEALNGALASVRLIGPTENWYPALNGAWAHLSGQQVGELLAEPRFAADRDVGRHHKLSAVARDMPVESQKAIFIEFLKVAIQLTRRDALDDINAFVPYIARVGGEAALLELRKALKDTTIWYP